MKLNLNPAPGPETAAVFVLTAANVALAQAFAAWMSPGGGTSPWAVLAAAAGLAAVMAGFVWPRLRYAAGLPRRQPLLGWSGSREVVIEGAEAINASAERLAASANEIVFAAQLQSAVTDGVKSMIDQVSGSVGQVTALAHELKSQSAQAQQTAVHGVELVNGVTAQMTDIAQAMNRASSCMDALSGRARGISDVASTITRIANQINLLSLNAAVEAARAGSEGRGFAVVAQEVKRLSQETAAATGQISQTIREIQADAVESSRSVLQTLPLVAAGVGMARQAETALGEIRSGADHLMEQGTGLSGVVDLQSQLIQDMVGGVQQILEMSSQTNGVAERSLDTSTAMSAIAARLVRAVQGSAEAAPDQPAPELAIQ